MSGCASFLARQRSSLYKGLPANRICHSPSNEGGVLELGGQCDDIIAHLCIIVKWDGVSGASQIWGENLTTSGELNWDRQPATLDYPNLGARPRRPPLCPRRTRRGAKNTALSAKDAEGREEHLFWSAKDTKAAKGREEHHLWSPQIKFAEPESQARNGPTLPAGVLILSYCEQPSPNVNVL